MTNKTLEISELMIQRFECEYLQLDVRQEIRAMQNWWLANPRKRKDPKGEYRFVVGWLNRTYAQVLVAATQHKFANRDTMAGQYRPHSQETVEQHRREMEEIARQYPELK